MWAKIITIKRTKDLNYFSRVHWIYLNTSFTHLSRITEINELFHDILIYWDAAVLWGPNVWDASIYIIV